MTPDTVPIPESLAWRLREAAGRRAADTKQPKLSQRALAAELTTRRVRISQPVVQRVLAGDQKNISRSTLRRIQAYCDGLEVPPEQPRLPSPEEHNKIVRPRPEPARGDPSAPVPGLERVYGDRQGALVDTLTRRIDRFDGAMGEREERLITLLARVTRLDEDD